LAFLEQQAVGYSYLFTSVAGAPLHEHNITEAFRLACDHAKVPECHPPYRKPLARIWQGKGGGFQAGAAGHRTLSAAWGNCLRGSSR
jgi:hypothetical protein